MSYSDITFAVALTNLENWGCTRADFRRLLDLDPMGCFKAIVGGKRVGITTATSYGQLGWIGNVVLLPAYRGRGIGADLVNTSRSYLEEGGAETVRLNSYLDKVSFYEGLGFRSEFENVRLHGRTSGGSRALAADVVGVDTLESFDRRFFGASRRRLLARLSGEFPRTFIALGGESPLGYLVGQAWRGSCEIAPWVADPRRPGTSGELWRVLSSRLGRCEVSFAAPASSRAAMSFARRAGMRRAFRTVRMYSGRRAHGGRPEGIIGLGGLDKG